MQKSSEWLISKATYYELSISLCNFHTASKLGYGTSFHPFPPTPHLWQALLFFLLARSEPLKDLKSTDIC